MDEDLVLIGRTTAPAPDSSIRSVFGRTFWTVTDQAVSSMTSLIILLVFAQRLDADGFGVLSVALSLTTLSIGAARAFGTDPLLMRHSDPTDSNWASAVLSAVSTSVTVGLLSLVIFLTAAFTLGPDLRLTFIILAVATPALCLQDGWRFAFFAAGKPKMSLLNDSFWVLIFGISLLTPWGRETTKAHGATLLWVTGGCAAAAVGVLQVRYLTSGEPLLASGTIRTAHRRTSGWISDNRDLVGRFLLEFIMLTGTTQLILLAVGAWHGVEASGSVRAAGLVLGPAGVVANGILAATVPEGSRLADRPKRVARLVCSLGAAASAGMIAWSVIANYAPTNVGEMILADRWGDASPLMLPLGLSYAGLIMATVTAAGLRSLGSAKASLRAIATVSVLLVVSGLVGAAYSAVWACRLMAVSAWIGAAICAHRFIKIASQLEDSSLQK